MKIENKLYDLRYRKLRMHMYENGIDAVLITSSENYLYMSGYNNPDGYMLITAESSYVFADFRYIESAEKKVFPICKVCLTGSEKLSELISSLNIGILAVENLTMTVADYERIKSEIYITGCKIVNLGAFFLHMRSQKDEYEVLSIKAAQRIAERAFEHLLSVINEHMTEIEVAAELEYYMKKNGSEAPAFDTIAVSGKASSLPHGTPSKNQLERGFLTVDFGAKVNGYCSDMTRTVVIGKADSEMKMLYDTVLRAQNAALDVISEGYHARLADKAARDIIEESGFKGLFGHGLGHGVGLMIHEMPTLSPKSEEITLAVGNIVTVEPGIYIKGRYGCRIEDMVYISENGAVNLTKCSKDLIEIL